MDFEIVNIHTVDTPDKGRLSFFEGGRDIPFEIKRIYYTYDVPVGVQRGGHAHRKLRQLLLCLHGEIEVQLYDGGDEVVMILNDPTKGLIVEPMVWHDMSWRSENAVLLVAASDYYNESDYIRDYETFLEEVAQHG